MRDNEITELPVSEADMPRRTAQTKFTRDGKNIQVNWFEMADGTRSHQAFSVLEPVKGGTRYLSPVSEEDFDPGKMPDESEWSEPGHFSSTKNMVKLGEEK